MFVRIYVRLTTKPCLICPPSPFHFSVEEVNLQLKIIMHSNRRTSTFDVMYS